MFKRCFFRFFLPVLILTAVSAKAVEYEEVWGAENPGVIITGESPECWFSPLDYYVEAASSFTMTDVVYDANLIVEYTAYGTAGTFPFETHVYDPNYNALEQVTDFYEERRFGDSGYKYHIFVSDVTYDGFGNVLPGYNVDVSLIDPPEDLTGLWFGTLSSNDYPGGGTVLDWQFLPDAVTSGRWRVDAGGGSVISSSNAVGTYTYENGILNATYTGTAQESQTGATATYTLSITNGTLDPNIPSASGSCGIDFDSPSWSSMNQGYWDVQKQLPSLATNPRPRNNALGARTNAVLRWAASTHTESYDVYLGTDPVLDANDFQGNQTETTVNPGLLETGTVYYWRVDAVNTNGTTPGTVWSFTVTGSPLSLQRFTVKAGKTAGLDTVQISGILDIDATDIEDADEIVVILDANDLHDPNSCIWTFPINADTYKRGKFKCTVKENDSQRSFALDPKNGKLKFDSKKTDLTGLACPLTVTIMIGDYVVEVDVDETILNGSKPSPPQLLMGVANMLKTDKVKVKLGKKPSTDSLSIKGYFALAENYNKTSPFVVQVGSQLFTVSETIFSLNRSAESCRKGISQEGDEVSIKLDFSKCTFTISVKKTAFQGCGDFDFDIDFFGTPLECPDDITIPCI